MLSKSEQDKMAKKLMKIGKPVGKQTIMFTECECVAFSEGNQVVLFSIDAYKAGTGHNAGTYVSHGFWYTDDVQLTNTQDIRLALMKLVHSPNCRVPHACPRKHPACAKRLNTRTSLLWQIARSLDSLEGDARLYEFVHAVLSEHDRDVWRIVSGAAALPEYPKSIRWEEE